MIPKIDVRNAVARKTYEGTLSFECEAEDGLVDIPFVCFSSPVRAELRYEIFEDNTVEVTGRVGFTLKGSCSRCLKETERTFEEDVVGIFEPGTSDGENYGYSNGSIDLNEFVRDSVLFALPSGLFCGECALPEGEQE